MAAPNTSPSKELRVGPSAQRRIESGHLWVFSNEVIGALPEFEPGQLVTIIGDRGRRLGTGYVNPNTLIAARLLARDDVPIDAAFFRKRFEAAHAWRERLYPGLRTVRLVHGEADGLPGLVVDRYEDHLAVQVLSAGMQVLQPIWLPVLEESFRPSAIIARNDTAFRAYEHLPEEVTVLSGQPSSAVLVEEKGVRYEVDVMTGQKTGLFLDQKDNRERLIPFVSGADVVDAFCYVGGWSLRAALGGARSVLGIDSSEEALTRARRNAELNGVGDRVSFERADVFDRFREMVAEGRQFDVVVVDPPAFAKRRSQRKTAISGYREINIQATKLVKPGGVLVSCSCSHHVSPDDFRNILVQAGRGAKRTLHLIEQRGAAADHPILLGMRETEYLKCLFLRVAT